VPRKQIFAIMFFLTMIAHSAVAQTNPGKEPASPPKESAPSTPGPDSIESRVERYLRNVYAWGPSFDVKIGTPKPSPIPELLEVPVTVAVAGQSDTAIVYIDKNGKFLLRGELTDMSVDPLGETRSKLHPGNSPSIGSENAKITIIEFADFECPSCRQLDLILRDLVAANPDIRLVYKDFPLTDLHPWAMTAAIAGQCTYQQHPDAFWKIHKAIFDAQEVISPSNVWDKMIDLGTQLGLNMETFRACMANPETKQQVDKTIAEGHALNITATPTTFVNGRRIVGPDQSLLQQYIQFNGIINKT
jgi:protein-disulfide isomerase